MFILLISFKISLIVAWSKVLCRERIHTFSECKQYRNDFATNCTKSFLLTVLDNIEKVHAGNNQSVPTSVRLGDPVWSFW